MIALRRQAAVLFGVFQKDYEKTFTIGSVPITVAAGATSDLGIRGDVTADTTNTVEIEVGPYLELTGYAEGGVGTSAFSAGIGIELLILSVDLPFHATLQVLPSYPLGIFTFEAPLIISTLDGKLYLYLKTLWEKYTYTILKWSGYEWELALIDPVYMVWAESDQFALASSSGNLPTELDANGEDLLITDLDYDWGTESFFDLVWQGDFNFDAGAYIFRANADESLTVSLDEDGDNLHETTLLRLNNNEVVDVAGYDDTGALVSSNTKPTASTADALADVSASGSMVFDGNNDYIDLTATHPIFSTVGTIEHWVKRAGTKDVLVYTGDDENGNDADNYDGFGNGDKSSVEIHTGIDENGKAYFVFKQIEDSTNSTLTGPTLTADTWYHLAATYDYNGYIKLYVNGVLEASADISGENYGTRDVSTHVGANSYIGRPIKSTRYFAGSLDEVRIWNDIRSATEINDNMNTQLTGNEAGLVAYYRFDDPSVSTFTVDLDVDEDDILGLEVEYENTTNPSVALDWSKTNAFKATYYDSTNWGGDVAWTVVENHNPSLPEPYLGGR